MNQTLEAPTPTEPYADAELACLAGAKAALHQWAATVATRDIDKVLALYAADAILVPTLSNQGRDCDDSRRRYFAQFLANEGLVCDIQVFKKRVSRSLGTVVVGGSTPSSSAMAANSGSCRHASSSPSNASARRG